MSYYFTILSPTDVPLFSQSFGTSKAGGDGVARFRFPDTARYMNQFIVHASLDIVEEVQWNNGAMYLKHIDTYPPAAAYISAFLTGSGVRFLLLHQPPGGVPGAGSGSSATSTSTTSSTTAVPSSSSASSASTSSSASSFFAAATASGMLMTAGSGTGPASASTSASASASASAAGSGSGTGSSTPPPPPSGSGSSGFRASSSSVASNPTSPQTEEAVRQFMNEVYENWVKTVMSPFYTRDAEIVSPVFRARVLAAGRKWL